MVLPKISIITPSYNQGQFLEHTIASITAQNYPNKEHIVVDGGSDDNSVEVIRRHEKDLYHWITEGDSGQSEAINKGFKLATGDILCWINSDDILLPGALHSVAEYFTKNPSIDFVNGYSAIIDEHGVISDFIVTLKQKKWYAERGIYYINQPAMFWKRSVLESVGLLNEGFHAQMDKELMIRIFDHDLKIGHLKKVLAGFRKHKAAKSNPGGVSETWYRNEEKMLHELYGNNYRQKPGLGHQLIYGLEKAIKGLYVRKWLFVQKWKGKDVSNLRNEPEQHLLK